MHFSLRYTFILLAAALLLPFVALILQTPLSQPYMLLFANMGLLLAPTLMILIQLGVALFIALGLGILLAWLANNYTFAWHKALVWGQLVSLLLPTHLLASIYEPLLSSTPLSASVRLGVYSGLSNYPLVYLLLRAALANQNAEYWYASRSMGVGAWGSLWRIGIRLNRPILVAAILLVSMEVLSDLATPSLLGIPTIATLMQQELGSGLVAQIVLSVFFLLLLLVIVEQFFRGRKRYVQSVAGFKPMHPASFPHFLQEILVIVAFAVPIVFGALAPLILLFDNIEASSHSLSILVSGSWVSVMLALGAALVATFVASLLAYGHRFYPNIWLRVVIWLASLGLVIPGLFIAFALTIPVASLDAWFAPLWQGLGLPDSVISQSMGLILYVLVVRYTAIALLVLLAALAGIDHELAYAARSLGARASRSFSGIELRLIAPFAGISLAFIAMLALKESGVMLVLLGHHHHTLTTIIYASLSQGTIPAHASLLLAGIVALCLTLMLWCSRIGLRK